MSHVYVIWVYAFLGLGLSSGLGTPKSFICDEIHKDYEGNANLRCQTECANPGIICELNIFNEGLLIHEVKVEDNEHNINETDSNWQCSSTCVFNHPLNDLSEGNFTFHVVAYTNDSQKNATYDLPHPLYIGPPLLMFEDLEMSNISLRENETLNVLLPVQSFPPPNITTLYIDLSNGSYLVPRSAYSVRYEQIRMTDGLYSLRMLRINGMYFANYTLVISNKYGSLSYLFEVFKKVDDLPYHHYNYDYDATRPLITILSVCGASCVGSALLVSLTGYFVRKVRLRRLRQAAEDAETKSPSNL
ncbi:unnamed protein product [Lymnaea stagnalis]|uniref:Uncharacterized protein n=1 Tax=Lymnaea stagnalis TaxID=6523 RepID=A0AAV2H7B1_LYMST